MLKTHALLSAMLFGLVGLAAYGQSTPWKAEIKLSQTSVKNNDSFLVSAAIRNTGGEEHVLGVYTCSYANQWRADNSVVLVPGDSCMRNVPRKIRLGSGGSYEKKVLVQVALPTGKTPNESITFRLGFLDALMSNGPRIWSNAVTISVTK